MTMPLYKEQTSETKVLEEALLLLLMEENRAGLYFLEGLKFVLLADKSRNGVSEKA